MTLFLVITLIILIVVLGNFYRHFHRTGQRADKWLGITLTVVLSLLTLLGYLTIGDPRAIRSSTHHSLASETSSIEQLSPEQIETAITALKAEIEENPNDLKKLLMLANSYAISQRYKESAAIWDKIIKLDRNADSFLQAADAHTFANQGVVNAKAQSLIERALEQTPQHPQGLWMMGMSAVQKGQLKEGKNFWQQLYPMLAEQPEQQQELAVLIKQLDDELNNNTQPQQEGQTIKTEGNAKIIINVSLDPKNIEQVDPTDTVFVFARAVQGPPAPLAVKRLQVRDLPTTIELTEDDAMMPQLTIHSFSKIKISAKVSKSGNPNDRDDDINSQIIELENLETIGEQNLLIGH